VPPAIYEKTVRGDGRDRQFCHDFLQAGLSPALAIIGLIG
jgi:hypothetical protein